jgi:hypothetical protein
MAHAGWFADFCAKHLVSADPYEFEETEINYLLEEKTRLSIKVLWNKSTHDERVRLSHIEGEISKRQMLRKIFRENAQARGEIWANDQNGYYPPEVEDPLARDLSPELPTKTTGPTGPRIRAPTVPKR